MVAEDGAGRELVGRTVRVAPELVAAASEALAFDRMRTEDVEDRVCAVAASMDFRVRTVDIPGLVSPVSIFEVGDPTGIDGCDVDSERSHLCGGVLWPGARTAAHALASRGPLAGKSVVEVGAGTGLVSMTAAMLGAADVLATDRSAASLELIEAAAEAQGLRQLRSSVFDLLDEQAVLPERVDVAVAADLLYSEELAVAVARTCARLVRRGAALIVTDSQLQWSGAFTAELARCLGTEGTEAAPTFERRALGAVTGWSYGDGGDATYDVTVGVLELDGVERGAGEANLLTTAWYAHF